MKLTVEELDQMCDELFSWWFSLQPMGRIPPDFDESLQDCSLLLRISTTGHEDWPNLYRGATNGIYGVFICLGWCKGNLKMADSASLAEGESKDMNKSNYNT